MSKLNDYAKESVGALSMKAKVLFLIMLSGSLGLEYFVHRHEHFGIDGFPFFYAIFGFCSCAVIIAVSKLLGMVLKHSDDYYTRKDVS